MSKVQPKFLSPYEDTPIPSMMIGFSVSPDTGQALGLDTDGRVQDSFSWMKERDAIFQFLNACTGTRIDDPLQVKRVHVTVDSIGGGGVVYVNFIGNNGDSLVTTFGRESFDAFLLSDRYKPRNIIVPPTNFDANDRRAMKPVESVFPGESMTTMRSWETAREAAIQKASAISKYGLMPSITLDREGVFSCSCIDFRKHPVCAHIAALFLQDRDRRDFLDKLPPDLTIHKIVIPVGMGRAMIKAWLAPLWDGNGFRTGEFSAVCEFDNEKDVAIIGANEGLLPYIKYVEGIIRAHKTYAEIDNFGNPATAMALIKILCKRGRDHTIETNSKNVSGLRKESIEYENFLIGTVATLCTKKLCIPCSQFTSSNDAPIL